MFKKSYILIIRLSLIIITIVLIKERKSIDLNFVKINIKTIERFSLGAQKRTNSILFFSIVLIITIIVLNYRENYIKHYNNKKFYNLLILFFLSIITLTTGTRIIETIVGWEYLGLTSLCLIIFYPNKTRITNSILTIIFNRIGDILLITILRLTIIIRSKTEFFSEITTKKPIMIILIVCRMTKRAQFPLSSWLPAAIRAPTPISAIVHSSTLVTAGIFLIIRYQDNIIRFNILEILLFIRTRSFLIGGLIRKLEIDFKKIIAFSTIRQIRIIITILRINFIEVSIVHIIYHAFFKTLLFCTAGYLFYQRWGSQIRKLVIIKKEEKLIKSTILIRIFSIRGLIFSCSFFTKDTFLEIRIQNSKEKIIIIFFIIRSILTIIYSIKIIKAITNENKWKNYEKIIKRTKFTRIFLLVTLTIEYFRKILCRKINYAQVRKLEYITILIVIIALITIKLIKIEKAKRMKILSKHLCNIKIITYELPSKLMKNSIIINLRERDIIIIKKFYLKGRKLKLKENKFLGRIILIITIIYIRIIKTF